MNILKANKGFTLIEMLLYTGLLSFVSVLVVAFIYWTIQTQIKARSQIEVINNFRQAMEVMAKEIKSSERVYMPTSAFDSVPAQLSLETTKDLPSGENITYVDFYLYQGRLFMKKEGMPPFPLTSEQVRVTDLTFSHFSSLTNPDAPFSVRINLEVSMNISTAKPAWSAQTSFSGSANTLKAY